MMSFNSVQLDRWPYNYKLDTYTAGELIGYEVLIGAAQLDAAAWHLRPRHLDLFFGRNTSITCLLCVSSSNAICSSF